VLQEPATQLVQYAAFSRGVKSVVIHMNFGQQQFDWVDLDSVLSKWQLPFSRISCGIAEVLRTWQKPTG